MKKKMMKMISMALVLLMLTGLVTGCGGNSSGGNGGGQTVKLLVPTDFKDELETVVAEFEKLHTDIKVEIVASSGNAGETPTELSKLAAGNNLPDVAVGVENFAYILKVSFQTLSGITEYNLNNP